LEGNDFSGSLPSVIGGLTKLSILDLRHNVLNFTIPTEVGNLLLLGRYFVYLSFLLIHLMIGFVSANRYSAF